MEYYLAIKKNLILPFATTWMDLEDIMLSEMSDKERQIPYDITYVESKKQTSEYNKKRKRFTNNSSGYQWGKGSRRGRIRIRD